MNKRSRAAAALIVISALLFQPRIALADSWPPPSIRAYLSPDEKLRLTVVPRAISSPLAYFEDKIKNVEPAGQNPQSLTTEARGRLEKRDNTENWEAVWDRPLVNDVAPITALVHPTGAVATFDNWHSVGIGENIVVVYDEKGQPRRQLSLSDFLPPDYIKSLPRSVSSIGWQGEHHFSPDGKTLVLNIVIPFEQKVSNEKPSTVSLNLDIATGNVSPADPVEWAKALEASARVTETNRIKEAEWIKYRTAPLVSAKSRTEPEWHQYLIEAFYRIDSDWKVGYPAKEVLRLPDARDYAASLQGLRKTLLKTRADDVVMIASSSQKNLVSVLEAEVRNLPKHAMKGARIYIVYDKIYSNKINSVFAQTGANIVQLDPLKPIPQRPERIPKQSEMIK